MASGLADGVVGDDAVALAELDKVVVLKVDGAIGGDLVDDLAAADFTLAPELDDLDGLARDQSGAAVRPKCELAHESYPPYLGLKRNRCTIGKTARMSVS